MLGRIGGALAEFNFGYTPISASFPKANAGTFKPYDPSVVVGDTTPTLPNPPPPDKGCGVLGQIIMIVVAVVATIATAGALAGASGSAVFSTGASVLGGTAAAGTTVAGSLGVIGTGMVAGAVGSIASQVAGNMLGVVDGYSWKSVTLGAISGGATAGVGQFLGQTGQLLHGPTWQMAAARAAVGNAITQGVGVITGLQDKFDWKGVAASAVGMNAKGFNGLSFGQQIGPRLVSSMAAGAAAAVMRGGKISIQQVAIDAFGNALGSSLASASSGAPVTSSDPLGEFIDKNMPVWEQRQANFDQVVGAFSTPGQINLGEGDLVAAGDGFTMGKMVSVIERGRTTFIDADDLSGLSDTELMSRAKALVGGSGSGGRGIGGSRELNASVLYQQGLGDIREYTSPLTAGAANGGDDLWFPHDGGGTLAGQRMTPAEAAAFDAANGLSPPFNFQEVNDQKVTAGAYDRFGELDRAWSAGNWSDMWRHIAFQASPQARDVAIQRSFPAPHPDMARIQRMANSPIGTIASSIGRVFGADQQRQDALLMTGSLLEQLSGTGSQVYKQTLTAPPPMPGTYARVRGVGKQARALPGITPETKRGVVQFQGVEVRAVRDLGHVDTSTLQAMQKYGFAAKDGAGSSLVMHHHRQNPAGPIIEMPAGNHSIGKATQHPFGNTKGSGLTPQQRAEFDQWRVDYWKWRATQELQNRGLQ